MMGLLGSKRTFEGTVYRAEPSIPSVSARVIVPSGFLVSVFDTPVKTGTSSRDLGEILSRRMLGLSIGSR
jgi:hypothetical protein